MRNFCIILVAVAFSLAGCSALLEGIKKNAGKPYRVSVYECLVQPTKANGHRWDVGFGTFGQVVTYYMDLQAPGSGRIANSLISEVKAKGEAGPAAPDLCVVVRTSKGAKGTQVAGNTYHGTWNSGFRIRAKDTDRFKVEVWDADKMSDHDLIGVTSFSVNDAIQSGGLMRLSSFGQVVELTIEVTQE